MAYTPATQKLLDNGLSTQDVQEYAAEKKRILMEKGAFSEAEVDQYIQQRFGMSAKYEEEELSYAKSFITGYQASVTGLVSRQKMPEADIPEGAPVGQKIAFATGQMIGDLPANIAGFIIGGGVGFGGGPAAPATVPVAAIGGAMAMPEALRYLYVQNIMKGKVTTIDQFWERLKGAVYTTVEAEAMGMLAGQAGLTARAALTPATGAAASTLAKGAAVVGEEAATLTAATTFEAVTHQRIPTADDLIVGAAMVGGSKVAAAPARYIMGKTTKVFKEKGENLLQRIEEGKLSQLDAQVIKSKNQLTPLDYTPPKKLDTSSFYEPQNIVDKVWSDFWDKATKPLSKTKTYAKLFDGLVELQKVSDDPVIQRIYQDARKIPNASKKAKRALLRDYGGETSLQSVLEPIKDRAGFEKFLLAKQSQKITQKGGKPTIKDNAKVFKDLEAANRSPEFEKAYDGLLKFRERVIREGQEAGYFSEQAVKRLLDRNDTLLSISHKLSEVEPNWGQLTLPEVIKNPAESLISDTYRLYRQFEINRVTADAYFALARDLEPGARPKADEIELHLQMEKGKPLRALEAEEFIKAQQEEAKASAEGRIDYTGFRTEGQYMRVAMDKSVVDAMKSLEPQELNIIARGLRPFASATRLGTVLDPSFWFRMTGVDFMLAPVFSKNNFRPVVDHLAGAGTLIGQWLNRKNPKWFKDSAAVYEEAVTNGAFGASYVHGDMTSTVLRDMYGHSVNNLVNLFKKGDVADLKSALNPWTNAKYMGHQVIEKLGTTTEALDMVARLGEYKAAKRAGKSASAAAFDAREINLDFTRMGTQVHALNAMSAFFNPAMQSVAKVASMAKNQPTTLLTRGVAGVAWPAFMLAMAHEDIIHNSPDSDAAKNLRARSQVAQDMYFSFVNADGDIYKIRTPFEIGAVFKMPAEALARYIYKQAYNSGQSEGLLQDMWEDGQFASMAETFMPPIIPTAVSPLVEPYINYDLFKDRPIIPGWAERFAPQLQSGAATTQLAKDVSIWLNSFSPIANSEFAQRYSSPAAVDHVVQSWIGGAGKMAWRALDKAAQMAGIVPKDQKDWTNPQNIPVLNTFLMRNPTAAAKPLVRARERLMNNQTKVDSIRELYKLGEQYGAIHKQLLGLGSEAKLSDIRAAEAQLYSASTPLRNVGKLGTFIRTLTRKTKFDPNELNQMFQSIMAITKSAEVQQMIWDSKGQFTPQLKDALIEEIRWQQIGLAERINAQLDAIGAK